MSPLLKFFALTYALSWALWSLVALVPVGTPLRTALFLPGTFGPAFVALWLGRRSIESRVLVAKTMVWEVRLRWYVFAFAYMAAIKLVAAIAYRFTAGTWPALETGAWLLAVPATLISTPFQAGEEIGWRGYAFPRMASRLRPGFAAVVLGVIWAAWHLPLFFIPGTDTTGQSFPVYLLTVIAISVAICWLYMRTLTSLLPVMVMHAAANNTPHFAGTLPGSRVWALDASRIQWLILLFLWIGAGYLLVRMWRTRLLPFVASES